MSNVCNELKKSQSGKCDHDRGNGISTVATGESFLAATFGKGILKKQRL